MNDRITGPHVNPLHVLSFLLVAGGIWLVLVSWRVAHQAKQTRWLPTSGPYAYVRHPQYMGFISILLGGVFRWPTIVTLVMFPVLVMLYRLLARRDERDAEDEFGDEYRRYAARTPAFIPRWR